MSDILSSYKKFCESVKVTGVYRKLPAYDQSHGLNFTSNDYLNLKDKQRKSITGCNSSTGSRLLSGNYHLFSKIEAQIALDKKTEDALIFNSGFQCNHSVLLALLDSKILRKKPLVFFDKHNHASLYQGVLHSQATLVRYTHSDIDHLESLLKEYEIVDNPKFIVTETLFSMDGDRIDHPRIIALAKQHQAFLYFDEAHAIGIFGKEGYSNYGDIDVPHVIVGTFGKALGSFGAYIACHSLIKEYLVNKAAGFIYSTALPPSVVNASLENWKLVKQLEKERFWLLKQSHMMRLSLQELGFNTGNSNSHIIPIILGDNALTIHMYNSLLQNKIATSKILPPTVPSGTSRLRISLRADHSREQIDRLIMSLQVLKK